jgi:hypothetical protein
MFSSLPELDSAVTDYLGDWRYYSPQSWVAPKTTSAGRKVHDVLIVGGGQNGLALAHNLKLRGIRRILVVDAQQPEKAGPWSRFARMGSLRSPKSVPGPECFNPLLTFKSWYCAKYSRAEYDRFDTIPLDMWCEYLEWYRTVLGITVQSETLVTDISWDAEENCLRAVTHHRGAEAVQYARKICLATGMDGAGSWEPPAELVRELPRETYFGAWGAISEEDLRGKDVAIIGAGASAFDNASFAVESQSRSVTVFARRPFPERDIYFDLWSGRDDSPTFPDEADSLPADLLDALVGHYDALPDSDRMNILGNLFRKGRTPSHSKYLTEVSELKRMRVLEGHPVDAIEFIASDGRALIRSKGKCYSVERIIFATGVQAGLEHRPELSSLCSSILTWGDSTDIPSRYGLNRYPKLSGNYQLQAIGPDRTELKHIYSLSDALHVTVGLQSVSYMARAVSQHIGASLFADQAAELVEFIEHDFTTSR